MSDDRIKERLLKLLALKRRGVGGESVNAARLLDKLLAEHGMTIADLEDEHDVEIRWFSVRSTAEADLLAQIVFKVTHDNGGKFWRYPRKKKHGYELTRAQYAEAQVMFSIYRADLKVVLADAFTAFIRRNEIWSDKVKGDDREWTEEQRRAYERQQKIARAIDRSQVRKQIG